MSTPLIATGITVAIFIVGLILFALFERWIDRMDRR